MTETLESKAMTINFADLRVANETRDPEWGNTGEGEIDLAFRGLELAGEVGEVCNQIKKLERHLRCLVGGDPDLEPLRDELGDVVICANLVAMELHIDLAKAIQRKFNKTSAKHKFKTLL